MLDTLYLGNMQVMKICNNAEWRGLRESNRVNIITIVAWDAKYEEQKQFGLAEMIERTRFSFSRENLHFQLPNEHIADGMMPESYLGWSQRATFRVCWMYMEKEVETVLRGLRKIR